MNACKRGKNRLNAKHEQPLPIRTKRLPEGSGHDSFRSVTSMKILSKGVSHGRLLS